MEPEERDAWIARIEQATRLALGSKAAVENIVIDARRAGASWAVVAKGVGTSAQAARERFQKLLEVQEIDQLNGTVT
jgi:hypothetical protein